MRYDSLPLAPLAALILSWSFLGLGAQAPEAAPRRKVYRLLRTLPLPQDRPLADLNLAFSPEGDKVLVWGRPGYASAPGEAVMGSLAWRLEDGQALWQRLPVPLVPLQRWVTIPGCGGAWSGPRTPPTNLGIWDGTSPTLDTTEGHIDLMTGSVRTFPVVPESTFLFHHTGVAALGWEEDGQLLVLAQASGDPIVRWPLPKASPPPCPSAATTVPQWRSVGLSEDGRRMVATWSFQPDVPVPEQEGTSEAPCSESQPTPQPFRAAYFDAGKEGAEGELPFEGQGDGTLFVSPSGSYLLRVDGDHLEAWNLDVGLRLWRRPAPLKDVWNLAWGSDERSATLRDFEAIVGMDFGSGEVDWQAALPSGVWTITRDGQRTANIHWDAQTGTMDAIQVWTLEDAPCH